MFLTIFLKLHYFLLLVMIIDGSRYAHFKYWHPNHQGQSLIHDEPMLKWLVFGSVWFWTEFELMLVSMEGRRGEDSVKRLLFIVLHISIMIQFLKLMGNENNDHDRRKDSNNE